MDEFARKPWLKPEAMLERPFSDEDLLASVKTFWARTRAMPVFKQICFQNISE